MLFAGLGPAGNAATRLPLIAGPGGSYVSGVLPEVQDLYERQSREMDRRKREELLHQIQRRHYERAIFAPVWENLMAFPIKLRNTWVIFCRAKATAVM